MPLAPRCSKFTPHPAAAFVVTALLTLSSLLPTSGQTATTVDQGLTLAIPEDFVAEGPIHRVVMRNDDPMLVSLVLAGAVPQVDYGSFTLLLVDATQFGGVQGLRDLGLDLADEGTLINLNGYLLDGADAIGTAARLASIPASLRASDTSAATGDRQLRLVQFAGPIKDEWFDALRQTGAHVVTFVPNNAYVVRTGVQADAALMQLASQAWVLSISTYEPAFKLRPELRPPHVAESGTYAVVAQIVADDEGTAFADSLAARGLRMLSPPNEVPGYVNVELLLDGVNVLQLAADSHVFAIEPRLPASMLDERQGQIVAGNLIAGGTKPAAPGYLAWLTGKGFPGTNPFPFAIDVTDDGIDKGSTSDVNFEFKVDGIAAGASRVSYMNNYSGDPLSNSQGGHGNINASIIGGYNALAGKAYEDSAFYNHGLGIAPWVKIGASKVFSNAGEGVFNQPANVRLANAYNAGARISSNSWGSIFGSTYNTDSQLHDRLVRDAVGGTAGNQELAIVFSAGNDGPSPGTVHPPGTAKNVITVGASENWRMTGTDGCGVSNGGADNAQDIINFSSRGPASDGRRKPEIMAPGTHIQGAASKAAGYGGTSVCNPYWPIGQLLYCWSSGTSHSAPAIAGACALVRQWFTNHGQTAPSPALLKAWLAGTAAYMTGLYANDTLWSNSQGFGLVNLGTAFDDAPRVIVDQTQVLGATGARYSTTGTISSTALPFRVTVAWTDVPGPTTGNAWVNNLDLEVIVNGTLYRGNVFSGGTSVAGGTADGRNNLESVLLPAGTSGSFAVTVRAANIAGDGVPGNGDATDQDFALVIYNGITTALPPDFVLTSSPASASVNAGESAAFTVSAAALNGLASGVALSASPALSGVTFGFNPNPVAPNGSSILTCATTAAATSGTQVITITGVSGSITHSVNVTLSITCSKPATPTGLAATQVSPTAGILNWQDNANDETAYRVARLDPGEDENNPAQWDNVSSDLPPNTTSFYTGELSTNETYKFKLAFRRFFPRVRAY